jgi:hypothetical protein
MINTWRPHIRDVNGQPIPRYIVHGGPALSHERGLESSKCQYFDDPPTSDDHRRRRDAMWERWVTTDAEHIYP